MFSGVECDFASLEGHHSRALAAVWTFQVLIQCANMKFRVGWAKAHSSMSRFQRRANRERQRESQGPRLLQRSAAKSPHLGRLGPARRPSRPCLSSCDTSSTTTSDHTPGAEKYSAHSIGAEGPRDELSEALDLGSSLSDRKPDPSRDLPS